MVFLAFLNDVLSPLPLELVTIIFVGIGAVMFLLPPVPGVPVYMFGGVVVVKKAWDSMSFEAAIMFTVCICVGIKLLAVSMQQKCIGERLGTRVRIRIARDVRQGRRFQRQRVCVGSLVRRSRRKRTQTPPDLNFNRF